MAALLPGVLHRSAIALSVCFFSLLIQRQRPDLIPLFIPAGLTARSASLCVIDRQIVTQRLNHRASKGRNIII